MDVLSSCSQVVYGERNAVVRTGACLAREARRLELQAPTSLQQFRIRCYINTIRSVVKSSCGVDLAIVFMVS